MSTFGYMTPNEALHAARDDVPKCLSIIGAKGVNADRIGPTFLTRTQAGYARKPSDPWRAHSHLGKFKEIARVEVARDADPGMIEVFFADGTTELIGKQDLLCIERPIT
jgi:hypothetical protein